MLSVCGMRTLDTQPLSHHSPYDERCNGGEISSGTYERITARTVSVDIHLRMPCSSASDMPNVDLPVPGEPLISMSLGGSFPSLRCGRAELNLRRCIEAWIEVVVCCFRCCSV